MVSNQRCWVGLKFRRGNARALLLGRTRRVRRARGRVIRAQKTQKGTCVGTYGKGRLAPRLREGAIREMWDGEPRLLVRY